MPRVADSVLVSSYVAGQSLDAIAADWRMPVSTVRARLVKAGATLRPAGARQSAVLEALREIAAMKGTP